MARLRMRYVVLLALAAFGAGWLGQGRLTAARQADEERRLAELNQSHRAGRWPAWLERAPCRPKTEAEQAQSQLALNVLETFDVDENPMQRAAVQHFGHRWSQRRGERPEDEASEPCPPPLEMVDRVAAAAVRARIFSRPFLYEDSLALAEQLGPRDPAIVQAVARSAFSDSEIPADLPRTDIRPYARLVLAQMGSAEVQPWKARALAQMSAKDQMGTGAAQVAAASGDPAALARVEALMNGLLAGVPNNKPVPRDTRDRLYELAFGLGMVGEIAQPYAAPVEALLSRQVESWAPPFGMIERDPVTLCLAARRIGGKVAAAADAKSFCKAPYVFEG
ncbi:hypothetical protein AS593_19455 [Caulobacter vibrioides]|nr:hypothetical protein AS593_19455 [Caulobacter vibrioides]